MRNISMSVVGSITRVCWVMALLLGGAWTAGAALEESFPTLQIGTRTYTNVTVTTKARSYVFLLHATGMLNVKVADMSPDLREKLGYSNQVATSKTTLATGWAKHELRQLQLGQIQMPQLGNLQRWWWEVTTGLASGATSLTPAQKQIGLVILAALYLFCSYCGMLICRKTGHEPGWVIWVPVLQIFPLLRSAGMAAWWFVAFLVPILNLLAHITWSVKIVKARAKSLWVALWLLLPGTNLLALLYLAFSSAPATRKKRVVEIMTLETA